jgi:hypothetical protein
MSEYSPIFVRSPRIISRAGVVGDTMRVELRMFQAGASVPTNPTYTLSKVIPSSLALTAHFDISPYCREFINHLNYTQTTVLTPVNLDEFIRVQVKVFRNNGSIITYNFVALDGYGYYEEEYNPELGDIMLDEAEYLYEEGTNGGNVYIYQDGTYTVAVYNNAVSISIANSTDDFASVPAVHPNFVNTGNTLEIYKFGSPFKTFVFTPQCEPKYTPIKCDFVNKYGVWQRITFFKASVQNFNRTSTEFDLMPSNINYNKYENRRQEFNINAQQSIKVNTGFVPETYMEVMRQIMLSEKIMLDNEPVNIVTSSVELQEHINKKLINYQLDFVYSHNKLNYVL